MSDRACLNHKDAVAVSNCYQCHKPICKECLKQDAAGSFCSTECMTKYKDFKARYKEPNLKKPSFVKNLVALVVGLEILAYIGHSWLGIGMLEKVDFLGKFLPGK